MAADTNHSLQARWAPPGVIALDCAEFGDGGGEWGDLPTHKTQRLSHKSPDFWPLGKHLETRGHPESTVLSGRHWQVQGSSCLSDGTRVPHMPCLTHFSLMVLPAHPHVGPLLEILTSGWILLSDIWASLVQAITLHSGPRPPP